MDEASALIAVSEIAVAVAGFSGVATALANRDDKEFWSPSRQFLFRDLLSHSAIALFTSLLALISIHAVGASEILWGGWSLLCALFGIAAGIQRPRSRPAADRVRACAAEGIQGILTESSTFRGLVVADRNALERHAASIYRRTARHRNRLDGARPGPGHRLAGACLG